MAGIEINQSDMAAVERMLSGINSGAKKAVTKAINKTVVTTKVQIKKKVGAVIRLKASRIAQDITTSKASYDNMTGKVTVGGEKIGLIQFAQKQTRVGTKVKVYKQKAAVMYKSAFKASVRGKQHLWRRKGRERLPIVRLAGPRVSDIARDIRQLGPTETEAADLLQSNLDKAVDDILRRY